MDGVDYKPPQSPNCRSILSFSWLFLDVSVCSALYNTTSERKHKIVCTLKDLSTKQLACLSKPDKLFKLLLSLVYRPKQITNRWRMFGTISILLPLRWYWQIKNLTWLFSRSFKNMKKLKLHLLSKQIKWI